ncbi:GntR family transcriptional regulator [Paenibacillus sambharensis]|uniref:GntR family transcriptional regulator n=1 Tax=Paenibacillus sambharensis TaxID=1803190 RepID=A0A2W1LJG9_9BACL|nr:GntR family transcriptional regulator [Paenibacillus sambharensis]PZD95055.1 GntR family transcriptional regulator [Paenibacillus sambharensis]
MWIPVQINEQSAEPLYHQIKVQLRALIVSGQLAEGTLLPSIREFSQQVKCSVITIRRVYQDLENEGLLRTRQGTGTFVAKVGEQERDRHRLDSVVKALEEAVDAGRRVQCDEEELRRLFEQVVKERFSAEQKSHSPPE